MGLISNIRGWLTKMIFGAKTIEDALGVKVLINKDLQSSQKLWRDMLNGSAEWNNKDVPSLKLASGICKEAARYTTFEFESKITGTPRADYLNEQYQAAVKNILDDVATFAGNGSVIFKPYARGRRILSTIVTPNCFFPLKYNELSELVSVVFADSTQKGDKYFTLLETHEWVEVRQEYSIKYDAFCSNKETEIGKPVALEQVEEWAHLQPENLYTNIPQPIFVECSMSNMQAIFAEADDLIKEADEQFGRAKKEFKKGEIKTFASIDMMEKQKGIDKLTLSDKTDTYVLVDGDSSKDMLQQFAPALRDISIYNGLNQIYRKIEFIVGFAYGIISDPNQTDKTAEEIRAGKQRFLVTIKGVQNIIKETYEKLVKSMDIITTIYNLAPLGKYEISFTFGDSIMEDPDKEYVRRKEMVTMGLMKPEDLLSWYFGVTTEQALEMLPEMPTELPD